MKKRSKILLSAVLTIALCLSLIAGSTFALFTSESKVNIAVTSGKVKVTAAVDDLKLYSAKADETGDLVDENGEKYVYELKEDDTATETDESKVFTNGGYATLNGGQLTLTNITPGDKIECKILVTNESNVAAKYRVKISANEAGYSLMRGMVLSINDTEYSAFANYTSAWTLVSPVSEGAADNMTDLNIALWLPIDAGNEYQNINGLMLTFVVEAVQGNGATSGDEIINYIESKTETIASNDITVTTDENDNTVTTLNTAKVIETKMPNTEESDNSNITVTIPANVKLVEGTTSLSLYIAESDETASVTVATNQAIAKAYNINVTGLDASNSEPVTVQIEVGDLGEGVTVSDITIDHNGSTIMPISYANGILTFETSNFSPFVVLVDISWKGVAAKLDEIPTDENGAYIVTSADQLLRLAQHWNNGQEVLSIHSDGNFTIEIMNDIDLNNKWVSYDLDGYHGTNIVTINGNGHTITKLNASLIHGGFAGGCGAVINDLTIKDSAVSESRDDQGVGAFIGSIDSVEKIELIGCSLLNSSVSNTGSGYAGGLIGWTAGYNNQNDGPVKENIYVKNCVVRGCEINANGSAAGVIGHSGANPWTYTYIENCVIENNTITSAKSDRRVGAVFGTVNVGEINDIKNTTCTGNAMVYGSNIVTDNREYGRLAFGSTGTLTINGVTISAE